MLFMDCEIWQRLCIEALSGGLDLLMSGSCYHFRGWADEACSRMPWAVVLHKSCRFQHLRALANVGLIILQNCVLDVDACLRSYSLLNKVLLKVVWLCIMTLLYDRLPMLVYLQGHQANQALAWGGGPITTALGWWDLPVGGHSMQLHSTNDV